MTPLAFPWLTLLVLVPALGAGAVTTLASRRRARLVAGGVAGLTLILALGLGYSSLGASRGAGLADPLGGLLVLDGLSGPLVAFSALLALAGLACASGQEARPRSLARILWLEACTCGVFASQHLLLLVAFWALSLLPPAAALRERQPESRGCWRLFALTQGLGCVALLATLGILARRGSSLHLTQLEPSGWQGGVAALAIGAVLLRAGALPLPSWVLATSGQLGGGLASLLLAPQVGAYLLARLLPVAPEVVGGPILAGVLLATAVYAALLALVQLDLARGLGCLVVSETALVLVGLVGADPTARTGALLVWLSVGGGVGGLILAGAAAEARVGRIGLQEHRGLGAHAPVLGLLFLLLGLASVGLPGSLGFVSEDLLFHGVLEQRPLVGVLLVLVTALNGFSVLRLYLRAFQGPASDVRTEDVLPRERVALVGLALLLLLGGLLPGPLVRSQEGVARHLTVSGAEAPGAQ